METTDIILLAQPTLAMLGVLTALWVYVEALNASANNEWRVRLLSEITALCLICVALIGGYWIALFHPPVETVALKGPWPWASKLIAAVKEHLFFVPLLLALYLPIVASRNLVRGPGARAVVLVASGFIVLSGLAIEGAGKFIDFSAKAAAAQTGGAQK